MRKFYILFLLVAITATVVLFYGNNEGAKTDGSLEVSLTDVDNSLVEQRTVLFKKGDTMLEVLEENFELEYDKYDFGVMITKIGALEQDTTQNMYISFDVNGELSEVGISQLVPEDGMIIEFIIVVY